MVQRDGAFRPQFRVDRVEVQRNDDLRLGHLDHDVQLGRVVVGDREPDAQVVHAGRDLQVRLRRVQSTRRMVVQQQLARLGKAGYGEDAGGVAPGDHARRRDVAVCIHRAREAHLAPAGEPDGGAHGACGYCTQTGHQPASDPVSTIPPRNGR